MTVSLPSFGVFLIIYTFLVIALDRRVFRKVRAQLVPENKIPASIPSISVEEHAVLASYQKEWEIIIQTQMHFNDLIIRFRSIVLTAFTTLTGASIALQKIPAIDKSQLLGIFSILGVLWVTAFVMDFFYYHRLLLGSVAQAMKFDDSKIGQKLGLFGLTTCISKSVHPPTSKLMVALFYALPAVSTFFIILYVWEG